jgi:hypothetical protein
MSFFRHRRSIGPMGSRNNGGAGAPLLIVRDESRRLSLGELLSSRARFRFAGCVHHATNKFRPSSSFQRTAICGLTGCLSRWVHPSLPSRLLMRPRGKKAQYPYPDDSDGLWQVAHRNSFLGFYYRHVVARCAGEVFQPVSVEATGNETNTETQSPARVEKAVPAVA